MKRNKYIKKILAIFEKNKDLHADLLKLIDDPKIKERYRGILNLLRPLLRLVARLSRFTTREIEILIAGVEFAVAASLYLKKNVLENPEVRKVILDTVNKSSAQGRMLLEAVSKFIDSALKKIRQRPLKSKSQE